MTGFRFATAQARPWMPGLAVGVKGCFDIARLFEPY